MWDFRKLDAPTLKITFSPGEVKNPWIEPLINCVRFVPQTRHIVACASDMNFPAKIFNYQTGDVIEKFANTCSRETTCDVIKKDGTLISLGDAAGFTKLVYKDRRMPLEQEKK